MNAFDFYTVKASASRISDLTKAGVPRAKVERRRSGVAVYGCRAFPRWSYVATLGYFDLNQAMEAEACANEWAAKGVRALVNYHCAD